MKLFYFQHNTFQGVLAWEGNVTFCILIYEIVDMASYSAYHAVRFSSLILGLSHLVDLYVWANTVSTKRGTLTYGTILLAIVYKSFE